MVASWRPTRLLVGTVAITAVLTQTASGWNFGRLRAGQWEQPQNSGDGHVVDSLDVDSGYDYRQSGGGSGFAPVLQEGRSLQAAADPQCSMPAANPCTLNLTAIGMIEIGFATYYDAGCEAGGFAGCFTNEVPECRTCYLSIDMYMAATNATERNRPDWVVCPCCVPTTLEANHPDIEVQAFDFSVFNMSGDTCVDPPPGGTVPVSGSPAPTPAPTIAATAALTLAPSEPTIATPAPTVGSRAFPTTPAPTSSVAEDGTTAVNVDTSGGDSGLSTGEKVGVGAGAAGAVILLGAAGFGIMKATGRA